MQTQLVFLLVTAKWEIDGNQRRRLCSRIPPLIFIKDIVAPFGVKRGRAETGLRIDKHTQHDLHSGWWCSGVMRLLPFSLGSPLWFRLADILGFPWL